MNNAAAPAATLTDAELIAAIDRSIAVGDMVIVTPELLAAWAADADADAAEADDTAGTAGNYVVITHSEGVSGRIEFGADRAAAEAEAADWNAGEPSDGAYVINEQPLNA